jgi:hypothetical protein
VAPSRAVPDTVGAAVLTGGAAWTTAVGLEVALVEPASLVAVTTTRRVEPTSSGLAA